MHVEPTMEKGWKPHVDQISPTCPRCGSSNTKFCYYNNYSLTQPRYFCKACRRYWTKGGSLRNVPVGGGCRKTRRSGRPHIIAPRPVGGGRINDIINTSLSPSPSIAKRGDHGSSIDLALVYANFLNQKPRVNVNDQNSPPTDNHHNQHHHLPMEIPGNMTFGGGNYGLMSFQFPYPLMSHVNNGAFLDGIDQCRPLSVSAYGHHDQPSDAHFSNAYDYLSGLDSIHRHKQAGYHQFMMNNSSVENVPDNPMSYNLPPLPGHDEELNILWSDSSNNNLVFPSSNTNSTLGLASQHDHDQLSSRIEEQRMLPQHDAAESTVQEPKQLGEINGIGSQINLPIELCNFLGLE